MTNEDVRARVVHQAQLAEISRIEFLLQRDGVAATLIWVWRTLAIYRRAVLSRRHFAHSSEYRRKFVISCVSFRHWLVLNGGYGSVNIESPNSLA